KREVVVAVVCDNCGKERKGDEEPIDWHLFSAHHDEWGNESIDSYEEYMVCSPICYFKKLSEAVKYFETYNSTEIDGMSIQFARKLVGFFNTSPKKNDR